MRYKNLRERLGRGPAKSGMSESKIKALTGVDREKEIENQSIDDEIESENDEERKKKLRQLKHLNQN